MTALNMKKVRMNEMSVLETFLSKTERLVFHMIDGSIVDIHMDFVKDIQEAEGFYSIYMDTGKMIVARWRRAAITRR